MKNSGFIILFLIGYFYGFSGISFEWALFPCVLILMFSELDVDIWLYKKICKLKVRK